MNECLISNEVEMLGLILVMFFGGWLLGSFFQKNIGGKRKMNKELLVILMWIILCTIGYLNNLIGVYYLISILFCMLLVLIINLEEKEDE